MASGSAAVTSCAAGGWSNRETMSRQISSSSCSRSALSGPSTWSPLSDTAVRANEFQASLEDDGRVVVKRRDVVTVGACSHRELAGRERAPEHPKAVGANHVVFGTFEHQ